MQTKATLGHLVKAYKNLFTGLQRGYGILQDDGKYLYVKGQPTLQHYMDHLEGKISLGIVPITDKGNCIFGALDLDDHHKKPAGYKFNYKKLLEKIKFLKLPLTVFKSKGGGAHCYLFLDKYYTADKVRHILKKFVYALGYERDSVEVFPKQDKLAPTDNGNFINLPYKGGNSRVLIDFEGNELNVSEAMLYAPKRVTNGENLKKFKLVDHGKTTKRNDRTFAATAFLKKHYEDWQDKTIEYNKIFNVPPLEDKELFNTVLKSNEKKDYHDAELEEEAPTELISYDISVYRALGIKKPIFIIERLIKEKSINFEFGPKGNMKTEYALGLTNALTRGKPFLHYECPEPYPIFWGDFEMGGYDLIERDDAYLKKYGTPPPKDYFHILHWEQQKNQDIPDIAGELGQDLILKRLEHQKKLVGKPPLFVLDNLRSASGYKESDSDAWRPIGKWLLKLRGLGFPTLILDHTGYDETHMRGTSSNEDWANVSLGIKARSSKGSKIAVVDLHFSKARGLRPDETGRFSAQYDFQGNWTMALSKTKENDEKLVAEIIVWQAKDPEIKQATLSKVLNISTGKVSQLMKKIKKDEVF